MIRRHVARARGRAIRALGAPNVPNLPSPRALAQRELRQTARIVDRTGTRRPSGTSGPDDARRPGSERTGPLPGLVALAGLVLAVWLLLATGTPPERDVPPPVSCLDRVVYHGERLQDC